MDNEEAESHSSVLGTKDFWESCYQREISNYNDHHDIGEIWFGSGLASKIVKWVSANLQQLDSPVLDIGCGNGHLIVSLIEQIGLKNLTGIDYAIKSVEFTRKICDDKGIGDEVVKLFAVNFLDLPEHLTLGAKFSLAIDKGTFDAICLNPEISLQRAREKYIDSLKALLANDGFLVIASCNWTREELLKVFQGSGVFTLYDSIETPQIMYGGKKGNNVICMIFKYINSGV